MSKRFTDSEKWNRPWFRKLPTKYKLLWLYILDHCDMAGVWYVDFELASMMIGEPVEEKDAKRELSKQIFSLNCGSRWHIKDFIRFQYGEFSSESRVHKGVQKVAEAHGIKNIWGDKL